MKIKVTYTLDISENDESYSYLKEKHNISSDAIKDYVKEDLIDRFSDIKETIDIQSINITQPGDKPNIKNTSKKKLKKK